MQAALMGLCVAFAVGVQPPGVLTVTDIKAACRNGQTFVTWKDAAEGEAGARLRYSLYRSDQPITQDNLAQAELCYPGVLNNSCKQFGYAFSMKDRLDPAKPTFVIEEGGKPLPMWSGLAVRTVERNGKSFYAVLVTDEKHRPVGRILPGQSAMTEAVQETAAPIQPIKIGDSKTRGRYATSSWITGTPNLPLLLNLHDGHGDYFTDRMDSVKYATEHHEDLPFYGWCWGRQDWVETWQDQIDMVKALTASHHAFALSWNNGGHDSVGARAMGEIYKYYPPSKFVRGQSHPAFGNSSINDNMGNGDRNDGDLVGGINLGFAWTDVVDEPDRWSVTLSNSLAKANMTVDVTPRWCQRFKVRAGERFQWTNSAGGKGEATADRWGLVTVEKVKIKPGGQSVLTISR